MSKPKSACEPADSTSGDLLDSGPAQNDRMQTTPRGNPKRELDVPMWLISDDLMKSPSQSHTPTSSFPNGTSQNPKTVKEFKTTKFYVLYNFTTVKINK